MYYIKKNIRIRSCNELSFLINIKDNSIFVIKTETLTFLYDILKNGLTENNLKQYESSFIEFIKKMQQANILGVKRNEN